MSDYTEEELARQRAALDASRAGLIGNTKGKTLWDVADEYARDAFVELRLALDSPSPRVRFAAADKLASLWAKMPPRPALPPENGITQEEFTARMDAAEQDAAVRAYLKRKGWTEPATKGAGN